MTIIIFTGPTLSAEEARVELDAVYLPPVAQGDVYRATLLQPQAIGIIDGYFDRVPAVWHKEILWAITQGIHVFGSASMGALRAAELATFGMIGIGKIFEDYYNGFLEDDDEVALVHGTAESLYIPLSEAMVNIRYTLAKAEDEGVICFMTRRALEKIAKQYFYPERLYPLILKEGIKQGLPTTELDSLQSWLPDGRVDQKRLDAISMLGIIRQQILENPHPKHAQFSFEYTQVWDRARRQAGALPVNLDYSLTSPIIAKLLEALEKDQEMYKRTRQGAMSRFLALEEARKQGISLNVDDLYAAIIAFRQKHRLLKQEEMNHWMSDHHLNTEQFLQFVEEEAKLQAIETLFEAEVNRILPQYLRASGQYTTMLGEY
jgi:hypothetical protein